MSDHDRLIEIIRGLVLIVEQWADPWDDRLEPEEQSVFDSAVEVLREAAGASVLSTSDVAEEDL